MSKSFILATSLLFAATSAAAKDATHEFQTAVPRGAVQRVVIAISAGQFTIRNGPATAGPLRNCLRDYDGRGSAVAQKSSTTRASSSS